MEFTTEGKKPVLKKVLMELVTSEPIRDQEALKKPEVRPSGPGALFGFNLSKVLAIVSGEGREERTEHCSVLQRKVRIAANHCGEETVGGSTSGARMLLKWEIASSPIAIGSVIKIPEGNMKDLIEFPAVLTIQIL